MFSWTRLLSLFAIFLSISTFSQESNIDKIYDNVPQENLHSSCCCTPCPTCLNCEYNCCGRIQVRSPWDVSLSGSYILWQAKQPGMDFGYFFPLGQTQNVKSLNMDFDYVSGFKVAICSKFDHDCWSVNLEYARLHIHNRSAASSPNSGYLLPFNIYYVDADEDLLTNNHANYCKNKWRFSYDMIDLECGRPSYIGSWLILNPFFGLRGGWIEQRLNATATFTHLQEMGNTIYKPHSYTRSNSWLLGPRIGVDSIWHLGCGFKLYGNFSSSLLYQYFKTSFKQDNYLEIAKLLDINAKDKIGYATPNIDICLGLGYGRYCNQSKWHIEISVLYDLLYFWNQNLVRQFSDKVLRGVSTDPADLTINGLTSCFIFDF